MDAVFKALADSSRRKLLDRLHMTSGQTLKELSRDLDMTRQAVTKHLAVLRRANLVIPLWRGREKLHYLNPVPLAQISERWINKYEEGHLRALIELKKGLEENKPQNQWANPPRQSQRANRSGWARDFERLKNPVRSGQSAPAFRPE